MCRTHKLPAGACANLHEEASQLRSIAQRRLLERCEQRRTLKTANIVESLSDIIDVHIQYTEAPSESATDDDLAEAPDSITVVPPEDAGELSPQQLEELTEVSFGLFGMHARNGPTQVKVQCRRAPAPTCVVTACITTLTLHAGVPQVSAGVTPRDAADVLCTQLWGHPSVANCREQLMDVVKRHRSDSWWSTVIPPVEEQAARPGDAPRYDQQLSQSSLLIT